MKLSASEAAQVCNVSERTIRRMIAEKRLKATPAEGPRVARAAEGKQIGPSRWSIDIDDLARCPGLVINRERLADLEAETGKGSIAARMDRLEAENRLLRMRIDSLESQIRHLTASGGQEAPYVPLDLSDYRPAPVAPSERPYTSPRREYVTMPGAVSETRMNDIAYAHSTFGKDYGRKTLAKAMSISDRASYEAAVRWLHNYCQGRHDLQGAPRWHTCQNAECVCHTLGS